MIGRAHADPRLERGGGLKSWTIRRASRLVAGERSPAVEAGDQGVMAPGRYGAGVDEIAAAAA